MKHSYPILVFLLSPYLFSSLALSQSSATVSIYNNAAFKSQRLCALECILCGYGTYGQHDCLGVALSCNNSPLQNSCYCRADLQSAAVSYVASCVSTACSNTVDVNNAVGIYTQYCATAGQTSGYVPASVTQAVVTMQVGTSVATATATAPSLSVVSSTVQAANGQVSTALVTVISNSGITQISTRTAPRGSSTLTTSSTTSLGSSGSQAAPSNTVTTSSSSGVDPGTVVGGVLGGVLILGIAAAVITWLILREKRKRRQMDVTAPPPPMATGGPTVVSPAGQPPGNLPTRP